jgi:hypothetical protein
VSLLISSEDLVEQIFLSWRIVHHDGIMEGDFGISKASSGVWPLITSSIYELWNLRDELFTQCPLFDTSLTFQHKVVNVLNILLFDYQSLPQSFVEERVGRLGQASGWAHSSSLPVKVFSSEVIHTRKEGSFDTRIKIIECFRP